MSQTTANTNSGIQPAVSAIQNFVQAFLTVLDGWSNSAQSISNTFATVIQIAENFISVGQNATATYV